MRVEIITIGSEILLGAVQDTNSNYLCRMVRARAHAVSYIAVVPDSIRDISEAVNAAVRRGASLVFTCGGLGPTLDDLTLAGIADAARVDLVQDRTAQRFLAERYQALFAKGYVERPDLDGSRLKMASVPKGSEIIENSIGAAPAVTIQLATTRVIALPGVPSEMHAIVEGPLQQLLNELLGAGSYVEREILVQCGDESLLAPLLRQTSERNDRVYIKSRADTFGPEVRFRVLIAATAGTADEATSTLEQACDDLIRTLASNGILTVSY